MKNTLLFLVAIVFAVTACNKQTYVDGTYTAKYDAIDSHGWQASVEFTLVEDVISNVDFDYFDAEGNRKSEDAGYQDRMYNLSYVLVGTDTVRTKPETYCPELEAQIEAATITPSWVDIDGVAGATSSSLNANTLMAAGLEGAIVGDPTTIELVQPDPFVEE
jgi:major membrane immunogen (membrane-anchored lipoprotein)